MGPQYKVELKEFLSPFLLSEIRAFYGAIRELKTTTPRATGSGEKYI
jgi:hypothetical protein